MESFLNIIQTQKDTAILAKQLPGDVAAKEKSYPGQRQGNDHYSIHHRRIIATRADTPPLAGIQLAVLASPRVSPVEWSLFKIRNIEGRRRPGKCRDGRLVVDNCVCNC